ncbi:MAG: BatA domain-containing protein [Pirellulales bacterium]|nr:BatA domain-containing protein [Pirellulales bacterium]
MGFLTPLLLGGIALVAIPVALHLVMRRQPKEFTFPALRFVQQRRDANRRRMKLRHLLLLALRCLLIAGLAAALARPTLKGTGLKGKEGAPLAVTLVVDNSLRMQYMHQNRTRLEQATETAGELVGKLPEDASVAVCDLGRAANGFAPDLNAAASRLRNLRATAAARPLVDVVIEAIRLAAEQEDRRQEVFVFSDLAAAAWPADGLKAIEAAMAEAPDVRIYVVDVGVDAAKNASLGELEIQRFVLRPGEPLHLEAPVASNLKGENPLVELSLQDEEGKLVKRGEQIAQFDDKGQSRAVFEVADLPLGTHQGSVQLRSADPLSADNTRYFTVEVRPPAKVLLLGERIEDTRFVHEALAPSLGEASSRFECEAITFAAAGEAPIEDFQAVLLLDPGPLPDALWTRLGEFAAGGVGVGVFLGHNALGETPAFNTEAARRLLPGQLKRRSGEETYLRPRQLTHPALAGLRNYDEIPWQLCRVFSFWQFDEVAADAYVVAGYANDEPAIFERSTGRGRTLTVTTPFSDPLEPEGREPWNTLTAEAWPFLMLCDELVGYLTQDADERLDYFAGETARVRLAPRQQITSYVLRLPDGQADTRVSTGEDEVAVSIADALGNYRLTAGGRSQRLDRGFSVNASPEISKLARMAPTAIVEALPKDRVQLADNLESVEKYVNIGRKGRELYAYAIGLVALIWGAEHVLANRFYRETAKDAKSAK